MKFKTLEKFLLENKCNGFTVKRKNHTLKYKFFIMYRFNKKPPQKASILVNRTSKKVMKLFIDQEEYTDIDKFINKILLK